MRSDVMSEGDEVATELNALLNGLVIMNPNSGEPWISEAFHSALNTMSSKMGLRKFVDCLHRRWLTDTRIVLPAVHLCNILSLRRTGLATLLHAIMLNDYRNGQELRKISRTIFANSARFMIDYFRSNYHAILPGNETAKRSRKAASTDSANSSRTSMTSNWPQTNTVQSLRYRHPLVISENGEEYEVNPLIEELIDPIFHYLYLLIDDTASRPELVLFHHALSTVGCIFQGLDPERMHQLSLQLRQSIVDNAKQPLDRALLLESIELMIIKWKDDEQDEDVRNFYAKFKTQYDSCASCENIS
ncbi:hypothetical protein M514_07826 [Trichuris suis]|uniref:Uncharacterized protein n=1 Tax=Trichuris suis TaxID=68888 RepID=A0A085M1Y0_9BILA|nr:hypothetical protein M513_07826 [Trichuris suis]KFD64691.1 hypothetical protein M514_07826 [Trichuris suis]KHJ42538.1 hypothetical protein D918_07460 [Trichuris suis]